MNRTFYFMHKVEWTDNIWCIFQVLGWSRTFWTWAPDRTGSDPEGLEVCWINKRHSGTLSFNVQMNSSPLWISSVLQQNTPSRSDREAGQNKRVRTGPVGSERCGDDQLWYSDRPLGLKRPIWDPFGFLDPNGVQKIISSGYFSCCCLSVILWPLTSDLNSEDSSGCFLTFGPADMRTVPCLVPCLVPTTIQGPWCSVWLLVSSRGSQRDIWVSVLLERCDKRTNRTFRIKQPCLVLVTADL